LAEIVSSSGQLAAGASFMKLFHSGLLTISAGLGLVVLFIATQSSADNPPLPEKNTARPAPAAPQFGAPDAALFEAITRREMEAQRFVREFQSPSSGIDLVKELKLTDDQYSKLDAIVARLRQETSAALAVPDVAPGQDREQAMRRLLQRSEAQTATYERAKNDIAAVLTPEQMVRVDQISLQSRIRISGMARTLASEPSMQGLNLTADQAAKLKEAETKAQEEFAKECEALREQQRQRLVAARNKVLSVLMPEQRAAYEKLIGQPVEIDDRTLDYGVVGVSARMGRDAVRPLGFGRGGFRGAARDLPPPPAADPVAPPPAEAKP
jgi:Spy/CpxP family protein refolding chaperone